MSRILPSSMTQNDRRYERQKRRWTKRETVLEIRENARKTIDSKDQQKARERQKEKETSTCRKISPNRSDICLIFSAFIASTAASSTAGDFAINLLDCRSLLDCVVGIYMKFWTRSGFILEIFSRFILIKIDNGSDFEGIRLGCGGGISGFHVRLLLVIEGYFLYQLRNLSKKMLFRLVRLKIL